ncbi:MAG: YqeG family HAD IIIA-type phosphatase [Thermosipho sp. (in: Bacteria)]|nr:YqeG family HAD IIIA-type phosphatase [Thermosipho sp. (in: thermotogales)]
MEIKNNIFEIDYDKLIQNGYRVFIFDFDNTLNKWKHSTIDEKTIKLFEDIKKKNAKVFIISNGKPRKLNYDIEALWLAKKPLTFKIKKFLKSKNLDKEKLVVIGDQIFTDMLLGKLLNAYIIKVEPIDTSKEFLITKFLRFLERLLLKILKVMI